MESAFEYVPTQLEYTELVHDLECCLREFSFKQSTNPLRAALSRIIPEGRIAYKAAASVRGFCQKVLDAYRANPNKSPQNTLIKLTEENEDLVSDEQKISELSTYIIAGHDTTGYSLSTALVLLAKHPYVAEKVRESLPERPATKPSEYLQYVMTECNRLIPVAATGSIRKAGRDFCFGTSTDKVYVSKGAILFLPQILPNRDASVFEDPDKFYPERWESATKEMKESILMFSLGKRNCIGQSLATAELNSVLPRLLSEYKFEIEIPGELDYFLTLKFAGTQLKATYY